MPGTNQFGLTVQEAVTAAKAGIEVKKFYVHKFGRNSTTASGDTVMEPGQANPYLTAGASGFTVRVAAGNVADDTAGTGAREITVQGLAPDFTLQEAKISTNGIAAGTPSTELFIRVLRTFVSQTGTGRVNAADVVIEDSGGATQYATIPAGKGQSYIGMITVPVGFKAYLTDILVKTDIASGSGSVEVTAFQRASANVFAAPFASKRAFWDAISLNDGNGSKQEIFDPPLEFNEYTDIWFESIPSAGTPGVEVEFTVLFEKDGSQ
jgi:hypothetical protein